MATLSYLVLTLATLSPVLGLAIQRAAHGLDSVLEVDRFAAGCNDTKSCFLVPDTCLSSGTCRAGVAVAAEPSGGSFRFEMRAVNSVYVAVGLSNDAWMGADSVVECVHEPDSGDGSVHIYVSYNVGTSNTRSKTSAEENGVRLLSGSAVDGAVECTFARDAVTRPEGVVFDLRKRPYHLLLASGSKLHANGIALHDREAAGSRNGRLLADVGMFVDPSSAMTPSTKQSEPSYEYEEETFSGKENSYQHEEIPEFSNDFEAVDSLEGAEVPEIQNRPEYSDEYEEDSFPEKLEEPEFSYEHEEEDAPEVPVVTEEWDDYDDLREESEGSFESVWETGDEPESKGFSTRDCNVSKSCFLLPDACLHTGICLAAASVRRVDAVLFEFEMEALNSVYVAVGLSDDAHMGSDSVVECVSDGVDVVGHTSWNRGHKNHRLHSPLSKSGIKILDAATVDGKVYCKFTRNATTTSEGVVFDLDRNKYHLLVASGSGLKDDGVGFHNRAYAGSHNGRLLSDVGMFTHRRRDADADADADSDADIVDAFQPVVIII